MRWRRPTKCPRPRTLGDGTIVYSSGANSTRGASDTTFASAHRATPPRRSLRDASARALRAPAPSVFSTTAPAPSRRETGPLSDRDQHANPGFVFGHARIVSRNRRDGQSGPGGKSWPIRRGVRRGHRPSHIADNRVGHSHPALGPLAGKEAGFRASRRPRRKRVGVLHLCLQRQAANVRRCAPRMALA